MLTGIHTTLTITFQKQKINIKQKTFNKERDRITGKKQQMHKRAITEYNKAVKL